MWWLVGELESIRRFLGMGGDVLVAIFILTLMHGHDGRTSPKACAQLRVGERRADRLAPDLTTDAGTGGCVHA